jgi:oxygen-dependent protoporphyrinogen oxidase
MIAIVGGGLAGLSTAYQLASDGVDFTLFEASPRLGGIVETVRQDGFVIECGPDSWVTEKPWARELAIELGLEEEIIPSNDQWRRTYILHGRELVAIPDGMRMMVPSKWGPLLESPLFTWQARLAYLREPKRAEELKASAPAQDESVATFVRRHFGDEVTRTIAGPLLAAVFGGDVEQLSVRAVMPAFVRMEAEHGSLVNAIQRVVQQAPQPIFTTLRSGLGTLIDAMVSKLPPSCLRLSQPVLQMELQGSGWQLTTAAGENHFDAVVVATPPHVTKKLLQPPMATLLPSESTSAIVVALAFAPDQARSMRIPRGFGFVVPPGSSRDMEPLLACTFVDQKFPGRVPEGALLLRAFFSGESLLGQPEDALIARARAQLGRVLGPLPQPVHTLVRRWPLSLPQYSVGHLDRMAKLDSLVRATPHLHLIGNAYYGVGLPDLIRQGRATAVKLRQTGEMVH